jgi:hypothetical protein
LCPSCRRHNFETHESTGDPLPIPGTQPRRDLLTGARLYWQFIGTVGGQLGSLAIAAGVGSLLPREVEREYGEAIENTATFVYFGFAVALVVTAYRLANWLGVSAVLWAVGLFLPCIGLLVVLALARKATECFRAYKVPMGPLGPRVKALRDELVRSGVT